MANILIQVLDDEDTGDLVPVFVKVPGMAPVRLDAENGNMYLEFTGYVVIADNADETTPDTSSTQ